MANEIIKSITHKVRNPRYDENNYIKNSTTNVNTTEDQRWLNIWSANFSNNDTYTITPSNNWSIPGNNISDNSIPSDKIISISGDKVNIGNPESSNVLVQKDANGKLTDGPQIKNNGSLTKFLNEKGEWIEVIGESPITVTTKLVNNNTTKVFIEHNTPVDNSQTDIIIGMKLGNDTNPLPDENPIIQIDPHGHVTGKNDIIIREASNTSAGLAPKFTNNATDENKILKIVRNNNTNSIAWIDSADLKNDIPIATVSTNNESGNGLIPGYTDPHSSGTFLGLNDDGVSWIAFTDDDYGVPLVSESAKGVVPKFSSEGQMLYVDKDNNNKLIPTWVTPKITEVNKKLTDCFSYTKLTINGGEYPDNDTTLAPAGRLTIDATSFLTSATFSHQ